MKPKKEKDPNMPNYSLFANSDTLMVQNPTEKEDDHNADEDPIRKILEVVSLKQSLAHEGQRFQH